jgi:hypothetical protein
MEIIDQGRTDMIAAIRDLIDANGDSGHPGVLNFYSRTDVMLATLALTFPCMLEIDAGVGNFTHTGSLTGTVEVEDTANYWIMKDKDGNQVLRGTCGDPVYTGKDISFNTLIWRQYDSIEITNLTITQPPGSNDYIP